MDAQVTELADGTFVIEIEDRAETFGPFSIEELLSIMDAIEEAVDDL